MQYTKSEVRSEFKYARELMRQAETLIKNDDVAELRDIACELIAAASTLAAYVEERGHSC